MGFTGRIIAVVYTQKVVASEPILRDFMEYSSKMVEIGWKNKYYIKHIQIADNVIDGHYYGMNKEGLRKWKNYWI